jgi:bifunctional UDP-N-acetylglucosamine pyrophosphorylase/glucosamine-1-phosphate N-acetyltransferase
MGALVLAAGKGTRMKSEAPKVLAGLLGLPMLWYVRRALTALCGERVLAVVGHGAELVEKAFPDWRDRFVLQPEQLGTGHALATALPAIEEAGWTHVLVVNGDAPLVAAESLEAFAQAALAARADLAFVSIEVPGGGGYGRVVRQYGRVRIVEAKDHDPAVHGPVSGEVNAGVYLLRLAVVAPLLSRLTNANAGGEYYITDLVELAAAAGLSVVAECRGADDAYLGINSPAELVAAEELLRRDIVAGHLEAGVIIRAAQAARLGPEVVIEPGAELCGPVECYGRTVIAAGAVVESHTVLRDTAVAPGARIQSFSHCDGARVGPDCQVGPYARLRPGAVLEADARVGNFVEMKKSVLGRGSKASHLTYLGDTTVGEAANIGAGTITCNYDGKTKHPTVIGDRAFIGSNSALVAPVTIGAGALVGAGSVITKDVPEGALAVARGRQTILPRR